MSTTTESVNLKDLVDSSLKKIGQGAAVSLMVALPRSAITYLGRAVNLLPPVSSKDIASALTGFLSDGLRFEVNFDIDKLVNATCFFNEFTQQYNSKIRWTIFHETPTSLKLGLLKTVCGAAVIEELLCRGLVQSILLREVPKFVVKQIMPEMEAKLDSTICKVARILFTSAFFAALHLINLTAMTQGFVFNQMAGAFLMGIALGAVQESNAGILGSISAHVTNNIAVTVFSVLWLC